MKKREVLNSQKQTVSIRAVFLLAAAIPALLALAGCNAAQKAKEQSERDAQAAFSLGVAFLNEGNPSKALQELTIAEAGSPQDPEILNALGLAYWSKGERGTAEDKLRKAVEVKPDYSEAWNNLGALYIEQNRFDEAITALQNALTNVFYSTQERALANLGWAYFKAGRLIEAEMRLREAVKTAPNFALAHKNLGVFLLERGDVSESLLHLEEAARLMPNDPDVYLQKGVCLMKQGEKEKAKESFNKAWHLAPGSPVGNQAKTYLDFLN